jgi:RNA polymerase sigma-70 factor (ECF subfamily)
MEEREAIQQLKQGDIAGLEMLVRRYQVQAVRAAYLVVRDRALGQDLVQTAFVRVFERIERFDAQRPFGPWFMKLVLNDSLKAATRRGREVPLLPVTDVVDSEAGPEHARELAETADEVWLALGQLTPDQRAAVVQRYYLELSESEMAARIDCPPSTVKSRLHAARERLRSLLRPAAHDLETTL